MPGTGVWHGARSWDGACLQPARWPPSSGRGPECIATLSSAPFLEQEVKAWRLHGRPLVCSTAGGRRRRRSRLFWVFGACLLDKWESCCNPKVTGKGHIFRGSHFLGNDPRVPSFPLELPPPPAPLTPCMLIATQSLHNWQLPFCHN